MNATAGRNYVQNSEEKLAKWVSYNMLYFGNAILSLTVVNVFLKSRAV